MNTVWSQGLLQLATSFMHKVFLFQCSVSDEPLCSPVVSTHVKWFALKVMKQMSATAARR